MTVQIQFRRGTTSDHSAFTGAQGEVTVNTTTKSLRVHDGSTQGGVELLRKDLDNLASGAITNSQLANSSITINGTSVSLGGSINISGGGGGISLTDLSVTDTGGDGSLSYNNTTGVFTYTGPSASDVRAHFTSGTGIQISSGEISTTITQYTDTLARASLSTAAGSAAYNSTTGVITIPTNTTHLTNGSGYITLTSLSTSAGSAAYNNTTGVITIPTNTTHLTNGSGYITLTSLSTSAGSAAYNSTTGVITIPTNTTHLTNGSGYITLSSLSAGTGITYNNATGQIALQAPTEVMVIAVSDETTALTTGTAKITFRAPFAMTLSQIPKATLSTASSSGLVTVDINESGTSVLGANKLSIDASEKTSTTAATATTISDSTIADDAEITIDIDAAGTGASGLKIYLYYQR